MKYLRVQILPLNKMQQRAVTRDLIASESGRYVCAIQLGKKFIFKLNIYLSIQSFFKKKNHVLYEAMQHVQSNKQKN